MSAIEGRVLAWLNRRAEDRMLRRFGGIQQCPWCRQTAQSGDGWNFKAWDRDPFIDVLTCGVCAGTSLWRFEIGMFWVGALDAPQPAWPDLEYYDVEAARLRQPATKEPTP